MAAGGAGSAKAERAKWDAFEKKWTRISMWLLAAGPALFVVAMALAGFGVYSDDYMMPVGLTAFLAPMGLSLLVGACAGLYVLGGPKAAPFGAVFVAGFALLVYGLVVADDLWRDVGVVLLAVSGGSFWVAPALSPRARKRRPRVRRPVTARRSAGFGGAFLGGVALAILGYGIDVWWLFLFGAMSAGTSAGGGIAMWIEDRRSTEDEVASPR